MLGIDPRPLDDELIYSILARSRALLGVGQSLGFLRKTGGTKAASVRIGLPGDLDALVSGMPRDAGLTADVMMERHTLLPYFSRFLSGEVHRLVVTRMREGWPRGGYDGLGYMHQARHWPARMRLCRRCVMADIEGGQAAGWRRTHQLPGVFVCPWHGSPLLVSDVAMANQPCLVPCPEEPGTFPEIRCPLDAGIALRIARGSEWLLRNPGPPVPAAELRAAMRSVIGDRGWLGPNGMARPGFVGAMAESYGPATLAGMGVAFDSRKSRKAAQRLWGRAGEGGTAPLACLLALEFLGADISELVARCTGDPPATARNRGQRVNPRPATLQRHRDTLASTVRKNKGLGRTAIRAECNRSYCYLNRNDPDWLDANLPARRRPAAAVDWKARDRELAREARRVAARLLSLPGRPKRVTFARIAGAMGHKSTLSRQDERLPMTAAAIRGASETSSAFRVRMLHWAAATFREPAVSPTWSRFTQLAGFKACEFARLEELARNIHATCCGAAISVAGGATEVAVHHGQGRFVACIVVAENADRRSAGKLRDTKGHAP